MAHDDVAISYTGSQDEVAKKIYDRLTRFGLQVFRYKTHPETARSEAELKEIFSTAKCAVVLLSEKYFEKGRKITRKEMEAAANSKVTTLLPVMLDLVALPAPLSRDQPFIEYYDFRPGRTDADYENLVNHILHLHSGPRRVKESSSIASNLRILMLSPEFKGYHVEGGLGIAVAGLADALGRAGHEVRVLLPSLLNQDPEEQYPLLEKDDVSSIACIRTRRMGKVVLNWLENQRVRQIVEYSNTGREERRGSALDRPDPPDRNVRNDGTRNLLNRAINYNDAMARIVSSMVTKGDWRPDVIQLHDWTVAYSAKAIPRELDNLRPHPKIVMTVHNASYVGPSAADLIKREPIFSRLCRFFTGGAHNLDFKDYRYSNLLQLGIREADEVTTVSRSYAEVMKLANDHIDPSITRSASQRTIHGILNGVRYQDLYVEGGADGEPAPGPFTFDDLLIAKKQAKLQVQSTLGLPVDETAMLALFLHRLELQKGIKELLSATNEIEKMKELQLVIAGQAKDADIRGSLSRLGANIAAKPDWIGFSERNLLLRAADAILMPSRFEPCGLTHIEGMHFGAVPIVSNCDGLMDSVIGYDEEGGYGVWIEQVSPKSIVEALQYTNDLYRQRGRWRKMMRNSFSRDFSWDRKEGPMHMYLDLFEKLLNRES